MENKLIQELDNNRVIGHTTETVFGLLGRINKDTIFKLNQMKGRDMTRPLQILAANYEQLQGIVENVEEVKALNEPKTSYITWATEEFAKENLLPSFNNSIMVRVVSGDLADFLEKSGPLFATSANLHRQDPILEYEKVESTFQVLTNKKDIDGESVHSKVISLIDGGKVFRE